MIINSSDTAEAWPSQEPQASPNEPKRTPFSILDPLDQYMIVKSIYHYLDAVQPSSIKLAVFAPERLLEQQHKGTWLEFYLCQAIVEAATSFLPEIVAKAKEKAAAQVEEHAKLATPAAKAILKVLKEDEQFRAALAMKGLSQLPESRGRLNP